jgi:hypothetical protein
LSDASGRLREIEVLFQRQGYESSQLRVAEPRPPGEEIGADGGMPSIYCRLAQVSFRQGRIVSQEVV